MKSTIAIVCCFFASMLQGAAAVTLKDALDGSDLVWTTGGGGSWTGQSVIRHDNVDAAQSAFISDVQETWLETKVTGPGTLSFWWRVSSEVNFDYLRFQVDGVFKDQISGERNWSQKTIPISEGLHALRWRYIKDANSAEGTDQAWVDQVGFQASSGAPLFSVQPASHTVWSGATVTFEAIAQGDAPRQYQWYFNETLAIAGATNANWTVSNAIPDAVGGYTLRVSNPVGTATSQVARLDLTNNAPALRAILFVDGTFGSAYEIALTQLGVPYEKFTEENLFNQSMASADPATTLVVLDAIDSDHKLPSVTTHIQRGGRALGQLYTIIGIPALATSFGVVVERRLTGPSTVYDWSRSPFLSGLLQPLRFIDYGYVEDGQRFHALPGAYAVAGSSALPTPGQAAVVVANSGRTIINGLFPEELASGGEAVRLALNQIGFLTGKVSEPGPVIQVPPRDKTAVPGAQVVLQLNAWGASPISYQWYQGGKAVTGATSAVYRITNVGSSHTGTYHATVSNAWGSVSTREVSLETRTNGPVKRVLLFVDPVGGSGYPQVVADYVTGRSVEFRTFSDAGEFGLALSQASSRDTLAIAEAAQTAFGFDELGEFVRRGGRAILHYWNMQVARDLANAFGATIAEVLTTVNPLYSWGDHPAFSSLNFPFQFGDLNNISGQRFRTLEGAVGLGGYTRTATASQAGIVLGNRGRTLLNGFFLPEILDQSLASRFAANELDFFFAPGASLLVSSLGADKQSITLKFDAYAGLTYQIERSTELAGPWKANAESYTGDNTEMVVNLPMTEPQQFYRLRQ